MQQSYSFNILRVYHHYILSQLSQGTFFLVLSMLVINLLYTLPTFAVDSLYDFSAATFDGTFSSSQWDSTRSGVAPLSPATNAQYTSSIKASPSGTTAWQSISWEQDQRYGVQLPDNQGVETQYSGFNMAMNNNRALYHFNEAIGSTTYPDSSGNTANAICATQCPAYVTNGVYNNAVLFNSQQDQYLTLPTNTSVAGKTNYSITTWFNLDSRNNNRTLYMEPISTTNNQARISIYLNNNRIYINGGTTDTNDVVFGFHPTTLQQSQWYHLIVTFDTISDQIVIILNGVSQTISVPLNTFPNTSPFLPPHLGNASNPSNGRKFRGTIDEFAIFDRTLSIAESQAMFRRGSYRVYLRARTCDTATCTGTTFIGPNGTSNADDYFIDQGTATTLPTATFNQSFFVPNGYFQYQILFETLPAIASTLSPPSLVKNVTVRYESGLALSLSIRDSNGNPTQICNLGEASPSQLTTCQYYVAVRTNAVQGYIVYVKTSGELTNGTHTIANASIGTVGGSPLSPATVGTERYGAIVTPNSATAGTVSTFPEFSAGTNAVRYNNTVATPLVQSSGPNTATETNNLYSTGVEHRLTISETTPPGNFTQRITYSVVPRF